MAWVGLTGGIGAGKSAVARMLAEHGATVIDADLLAREVVAPGTPGLAAVAEAFGDKVIGPDGALDRPALGAIVFSDPQARRRLEAITHPLIGARTAALIEAAPPGAVIVHDVPLLVEAGLSPGYDLVIVVEAPRDLRLARLEQRGLPREQAEARMASQASDEQRRAVAGIVIDNGGSLADLWVQVDEAWPRIAAAGAPAT